ncbi:MAG: cation:proton antiporter [Planctomycetes bacterium]|nr:cation:proton antiporter [Planctomycetota bacterium]
MASLTPHEVAVMFMALGTLLASARLLGELAKRYHQPAVLGELLAGIFLGPTVLGALAPQVAGALFPSQGGSALVLDGITTLAITLFLLVAGMEVDLSTIWRQRKAAVTVGISGIVGPFALGFATAWMAPRVMGKDPSADPLIFALFIATALSISALPVIAKTLMDLDLYRTEVGMTVIAAAVLNDLAGWIIFAILLGMLGTPAGHGLPIGHTIGITLGFVVFMLTLGRWLAHRIFPWIQAHASWPGGVLSFILSVTLFGAAFTEWIGIHAIFGAFLVGVAMGDSAHLREQTRSIIDEFISFFFAPLFFASVGLKVNFAANFDLVLVTVVLIIACIGKVAGCALGARLVGMAARTSWALGFAMNARGTMEIILGLLALQFGLIRERTFVALVIMALVTSLMSGPIMQRILKRKKPSLFLDLLETRSFLNRLSASNAQEAIHALVQAACPLRGLKPEEVEAAVWQREEVMPTGVGHGLALPHARIDALSKSVVAIGLSRAGIDFGSDDGQPAHIIGLLLTPKGNTSLQLELLADITRTFSDREFREKALQARNYTEFLALLKLKSSKRERSIETD